MFYNVYFGKGRDGLMAICYRLDDWVSNQCRVNVSDSIYRPVGNCSPDGKLQGALLER
jgi:hypothetical protein